MRYSESSIIWCKLHVADGSLIKKKSNPKAMDQEIRFSKVSIFTTI